MTNKHFRGLGPILLKYYKWNKRLTTCMVLTNSQPLQSKRLYNIGSANVFGSTISKVRNTPQVFNKYSGPSLIRSPLGNGNLALLEGWPLVRGIVDTIIHGMFSESIAL